MATIVNTTPATRESDTFNWSALMIVMLVVAFIVFVLYYGLPALQNAGAGTQTAPQIQVPEQVDVNVNQRPQ